MNNQKGFSTIAGVVIGILVLSAVAFGFWLWWANQCPDCPKTLQNETAGWITYRSEKYDFEFRYPPEFRKSKEGDDRIILEKKSQPATTFVAWGNPTVGFEGYDFVKPAERIAIDGIETDLYFGKSTDGQRLFRVWRNNIVMYMFTYEIGDGAEATFRQILATAKF